MVEQARERLPEAVDVRQADLLELTVDEPVDAILSTATFHWIPDHDTLFARLRDALKPGGRLVAQCGGEGNVAAVKQRRLRAGAPRAVRRAPAGVAGRLALRLARGHRGAAAPPRLHRRVVLELARGRPRRRRRGLPRRDLLGSFLERLPEELHEPFIDAAVEQLGAPLTIHYVRLNILARTPVPSALKRALQDADAWERTQCARMPSRRGG